MPACIDTLIDELTSDDESTRRFAVEDLGSLRDPQVVQPLFSMLEDESAAVREAAIEALVCIGGEETVLTVLPALRADNAPLRNDACLILQRIGNPAITHLAQLLTDEDKDVRKFAVDVLAVIGTTSAQEAITRSLRDTDINVAIAAAEALGRIGCREAVGAMTQSLRATTWMRCAVAKSLGRIGGHEAVRTLTELIGDTDDMVVFVASQALGANGDETSLQYMLHLLDHANPMVVDAALAAIVAIIERTDPSVWQSVRDVIPIAPIVRLIVHPKPAMRRSAAVLLGKIKHPASLSPLVTALACPQNQPLQEVREVIATAIVSLAPEDVSPITRTLLAGNTSAEARCELIDVLGRLGRRQAFDAVARMVQDADPRVRRVATRCLAGLDPDRAGAVLCRCLVDGDGHVRAHAARGIGSLLSRQDVPLLLPLFEDPCDVVRQAAAWAVATIGGEEAIDVVNGLSALLDDPYPDVRHAGAQALASIRDAAAIEVLVSRSLCGSEDGQLAAVRALASAMGHEQADATLRKILASGLPHMQVEALRSLSNRGCQLSEHELLAAAQSFDSRLRLAAVKLLAQHKGPPGLECLIRMLHDDPDPRVCAACARGLGRSDAPQALEALIRYLKDGSSRPVVIIAVIESLGRIGCPSALTLLESWVTADDPEVAEAALLAVQAIGERTAIRKERDLVLDLRTQLRGA